MKNLSEKQSTNAYPKIDNIMEFMISERKKIVELHKIILEKRKKYESRKASAF